MRSGFASLKILQSTDCSSATLQKVVKCGVIFGQLYLFSTVLSYSDFDSTNSTQTNYFHCIFEGWLGRCSELWPAFCALVLKLESNFEQASNCNFLHHYCFETNLPREKLVRQSESPALSVNYSSNFSHL